MKDLTGQKFGRLTAVRPLRSDKKRGVAWLCRCDCGQEKEVFAARLASGHTRSCGCIREESWKKRDITGQRFGTLIAIERCAGTQEDAENWIFQCDCGNQVIMSYAAVRYNHTGSCGCMRPGRPKGAPIRDLTGQRFGRLTALAPTEERDKYNSVIWNCLCDCGKDVCFSIRQLKRGNTLSCGCAVETELRESREKAQRRNNRTGYTGVYQEKKTGKWHAYINSGGKRYFLGSYPTCQEAAAARADAEKQLQDRRGISAEPEKKKTENQNSREKTERKRISSVAEVRAG